jgi:DNA-directed RNA polymerase subunit RPC12/RpoP
MDNIEEYLSQFEDFELAFFWKYKLDTYMEGTQNEIKAYLRKRNLDEAKMNSLMEEYSHKLFPESELRCPRCKSKKLTTKRDPIFTGRYYGAINLRNVHYICSICGLSFEPAERAGSSLIGKIFIRFLKWRDRLLGKITGG